MLTTRTGVESFVVGLAPNYWCHTPLLISQLLTEVIVVDGISCLRVNNSSLPDNSENNNSSLSHSNSKLVPVTKCAIVGVIVTAEIRPESVTYVIDDGTGLVDCLVWNDPAADMFLLVVQKEQDHHQNHRVGDLVRVYGRIVHFCGAPPPPPPTSSLGIPTTSVPSVVSIREVHADLIEPVSWSTEAQHWARCSSYRRGANIQNANDILGLLGPRLEAQIRDPTNQPPEDDELGAWRLFGTRCRCQTLYKEALLYCHCHATPEPLDPAFAFRDFLLEKLVAMEKKNEVVSSCSTGTGTNSNENHQHQQELRFCYSAIKSDSEIDQALTKQASMNLLLEEEESRSNLINKISSNRNNVIDPAAAAAAAASAASAVADDDAKRAAKLAVQKDRLLRGTFRALRHDGIVALVDMDSDTYLLISCQNVLARECIRSNDLKQKQKNSRRPAYLSKVPRARLDLVQRRLLAAKRQQQQQQHQQHTNGHFLDEQDDEL